MKKLNILTSEDMNRLVGGREVIKNDLNDDGRWDIKTVTTKNRVKVVIRDADGGRHVTKLRLA